MLPTASCHGSGTSVDGSRADADRLARRTFTQSVCAACTDAYARAIHEGEEGHEHQHRIHDRNRSFV
jgi:hypothetical protein